MDWFKPVSLAGVTAVALGAGLAAGFWFQRLDASPRHSGHVHLQSLNDWAMSSGHGSGPAARIQPESPSAEAIASEAAQDDVRYFPEVVQADAASLPLDGTRLAKPAMTAEEQARWRQQLRHLPPEQTEEILRIRQTLGPIVSETSLPELTGVTPPALFPALNDRDLKPALVSAAALPSEAPNVIQTAAPVPSGDSTGADSSPASREIRPEQRLLEEIQAVQVQNGRNGEMPGYRRIEIQVPGGLSAIPLVWLKRLDLRPGNLVETKNPFDVAIEGAGWFQVRGGDQLQFTRSGLLAIAREHQLGIRTSAGILPLEPPVALPKDGFERLVIQPDGQCQVRVEGTDELRPCGKIVLFEFRDAAALRLQPVGLYASTEDSGRAFASRQDGTDLILRQGWLEESNATPDKEAGHDRMVLQLSHGSGH